mgnify:CR=1 FL=1
MNFKELNEENFVMFAIKNYNNPHCKSLDEFNEDLQRIIYLKRLFKKYYNGGELRERLILNHLITLYNVFGIEPTTKILFYKIDEKLYSILKTFLIYLNYIRPDIQPAYISIDVLAIPLDQDIVKRLRSI